MANIGAVSRSVSNATGPKSSSVDLSKVPSEMRGLLEEQMKMNQEQQLVTRLTNLIKHKHEMAMAVLNNMK